MQTLAVVGLNILCAVLDTKFDYSVVLYAFIAIAICYFTLFASPRALLEKIYATVIGDSVLGVIAYDKNGKCIGVNQSAGKFFPVTEKSMLWRKSIYQIGRFPIKTIIR